MHHDVTIWGKDLLTYFASCVYAYHPPTYTVRKGNIAVDGRWEVFSSRSNCVCDGPGDTDERAWTRQHESAKRPWRTQHLCFWHLPTENKNAEQKAWARFGYNCAISVACGVLQGTATFSSNLSLYKSVHLISKFPSPYLRDLHIIFPFHQRFRYYRNRAMLSGPCLHGPAWPHKEPHTKLWLPKIRQGIGVEEVFGLGR